MKRITDLGELLTGMEPRLSRDEFFMATVSESQMMSLTDSLDYILCIYREKEGLTIIFSSEAKEEISRLAGEEPIVGPFALITLDVYSDLMAVGFLAKIADSLANERIGINVFSAYNHDHFLVPYEKRDDAIRVLKGLQEQKKG
jgi:hypothetical protein